jgi:hypothetical protein
MRFCIDNFRFGGPGQGQRATEHVCIGGERSRRGKGDLYGTAVEGSSGSFGTVWQITK